MDNKCMHKYQDTKDGLKQKLKAACNVAGWLITLTPAAKAK